MKSRVNCEHEGWAQAPQTTTWMRHWSKLSDIEAPSGTRHSRAHDTIVLMLIVMKEMIIQIIQLLQKNDEEHSKFISIFQISFAERRDTIYTILFKKGTRLLVNLNTVLCTDCEEMRMITRSRKLSTNKSETDAWVGAYHVPGAETSAKQDTLDFEIMMNMKRIPDYLVCNKNYVSSQKHFYHWLLKFCTSVQVCLYARPFPL